jgi:hypothetical protein
MDGVPLPEFCHHRGKELVEAVGPALVADDPLGPFPLDDDDPSRIVHFAVSGTIDLQEAAQALGRGFHDLIGLVEAAQLIVEI